MTASASSAASLAAADAAVMHSVLASSILSDQLIASPSGINPANTPNFSVNMANIGLSLGFIIECYATITAGANALTATEFGPVNILDTITFTDYDSTTRINIAARKLWLLNALRHGAYLGASPDFYDSAGNQIPSSGAWPIIDYPKTIAANASATVKFYLYVPLARAPQHGDFRGAMFSQISGKTASLQINFAAAAVALGSDAMRSAYTGGGAATVTNIGFNIWQQYYDQLPMTGSAYQMAPLSWSSLYQLLDGATVNNPVALDYSYLDFTTVREYYGNLVIYNNNGVLNQGTDMSKMTFFRQLTTPTRTWTPNKLTLETRRLLGRNDLPSGCYFFDWTYKPVTLAVFGNSRIGLMPSAVTAGAAFYTADEFVLSQSALPLVMG
ncbi:MAG: hypothetical protein ACYDBH_12270 [Acidobacteriaceae bacterium]